MDRDLHGLTLVQPVAAEVRIVDLLLDSTPSPPGFTRWRGEGLGARFERSSTREKVRDSIERNMPGRAIERARLADPLAGCAGPDLACRAEQAERFGRLKSTPWSRDPR